MPTRFCLCGSRQALLRASPVPFLFHFPAPADATSASASSSLCAVCIVDFTCDEEICRLPRCLHVFHAACIDSWLQLDHATCPLCRTLLVELAPPSPASSDPYDVFFHLLTAPPPAAAVP